MDTKEKRFSGMRKVFSQITQKVKRSSNHAKPQDSEYEELPAASVSNERKSSNVSTDHGDGFLAGDWEGGGTGRSSMLFTRYEKQRESEERSEREQREQRENGAVERAGVSVARPKLNYFHGRDFNEGRGSVRTVKEETEDDTMVGDADFSHSETLSERSEDGKKAGSSISEGKEKEGSSKEGSVKEGSVKDGSSTATDTQDRQYINVGGDIYTLPDKTINRQNPDPVSPKPVSDDSFQSVQNVRSVQIVHVQSVHTVHDQGVQTVQTEEKGIQVMDELNEPNIQGIQSAQRKYSTQSSQSNYGTQSSQDEYGTQSSQSKYGTQSSQSNYGTQSSQDKYGTQSSQSKYGTQSAQSKQGTQSKPISNSQQLFVQPKPQTQFASLPDLDHQKMNYHEDEQRNPLYHEDDDDEPKAPPLPYRNRTSLKKIPDEREPKDDVQEVPLESTMDFDSEEEADPEAMEYIEEVVRVVSEEREQLRVISDLDSVLENEDDNVVEEPKPDPTQIHKNWSYVSEKDSRKKDPDLMYQNWESIKAEKVKNQPVYENFKAKVDTEKSWPGADNHILEELESMQIQKLCQERSGSVVLTDEFNPKHFLGDTPTHDASGMEIPAWKRHIMARQLAEKAAVEGEARKKKEEEEARFKNMPPWKRALIEKKESDFRSSQPQVEKADPEKSSSSAKSGPSWKHGFKSRKF